MHQVLLDFLKRLSGLDTEKGIGEPLLQLFKSLGADGGNIWFAVADASGERPSEGVVNSVSDFTDEYLSVQYHPDLIDRVQIPHLVEGTHMPFRYGFDVDRYRFGEDAPDTVQAKAAQNLMGLRNALIIPIPTVGKQGSSGVSFYSTDTSENFELLWQEKGLVFAYAGHAAHLRMQQIKVSPSQPKLHLTDRERDCLLLTARGVRAKEIAHRLGIAEVTVGLHMSNARKKLDARTLPEAVVKAVVSRQISP